MLVSIIIPSYNRAAFLERTLRSISAYLPPEWGEILIVDNASTDETESVSKRVQGQFRNLKIRYLFEPVPGLLSGRHRGAREAHGDILVFIDDDISVAPRWFSGIVKAFADPVVQIVGGRSFPDFESRPPAWLHGFWTDAPGGGTMCAWLSLIDMGNRPMEIDPGYVWGLNFAIRRASLFDLGGFHPDCIPQALQKYQGDGETGLSNKARERGSRAAYAPDAVVHHLIPASRMTPEAFEARAFYQGICDSYSRIRQQHFAVSPVRQRVTYQSLRRLARRAIRLPASVLEKLRSFEGSPNAAVDAPAFQSVWSRTEKAYASGYQFHQLAFRTDRSVREWVLKPDYWDYSLPSVPALR